MLGTKKEKNLYPLSWGLLLLLVFIAVFGTYLMPHPITPEHKISFITGTVDGVETKIAPPYPPSSGFWLGTDHRGYDLLSLLLNGAKYTLGFAFGVTVLRFIIALPIGLYAGTTGRGRSTIAALQLITSAVPALLLVYPTMHGLSDVFMINQGLPANDPKLALFTWTLFGLMVFVGIFQLTHQFSERANFYSGKLFVIVAKTMGASNRRIVFKHLLPHLRVEMLFAFLMEYVQVLFLLGQLAVVFIFVGGGEKFVVEDSTPFTPEVSFLLTTSGEWGGLIAYGSRYLREYPWIMLAVGACFICAMLIVLFFADQLQKQMEDQVAERRKPLWKNKPVLASIGGAVVACAALLVFVPNSVPGVPDVESVFANKQSEADSTKETGTSKNEVPASLRSNDTASTQPATPADEEALVAKDMKEYTERLMTYIVEGNWDYVQVIVTPNYYAGYNSNRNKKPEIPEPYNSWLLAFSEKNWKYEGIGEVKKVEDREYEVEMKVLNASGQPVSWYVVVQDKRAKRSSGTASLSIVHARGEVNE